MRTTILTDEQIDATLESIDCLFWDVSEGATHDFARAIEQAVLKSQNHPNRQGRVIDKLFCDMKTDEEKAAFFLSGRGYETGVIAQAIQNDVAMAYHRCVEYKKELEALQSQDRRDAERYRRLRKGDIDDVAVVRGLGAMDYGASAVISTYSEEIDGDDLDAAIDLARRAEEKL